MKISGIISGLIFVHVIYGISFTTLFFRNYYVTIPLERLCKKPSPSRVTYRKPLRIWLFYWVPAFAGTTHIGFLAQSLELVKAAKVDGVGFFRIFWSIFMPLSAPIVVVAVIWQFTQIWNDFLFGSSFSQSGTQPITVALNNIVNSTTGVKEYNVDMAAAIIATLPTLFVYVVAGKYFIRGLTAGSVKG